MGTKVFNRKKVIVIISCLMLIISCAFGQTSTLVSVGAGGQLVYTADVKGNKIPDYSGVGYMNSEAAVPIVAVVKIVNAVAGDNLANVQNAINEVASYPMDANGFRGAILFKSGTYNISNSITVNASGIVLRGEGFNGSGTNFIATRTAQHTLINFVGIAGTTNITATAKAITDAYVPVGAKQVTVAAGHSFVVGDNVFIHRIPNAAWISMLGMDLLSSIDPAATNWTASAYDLYYERKVTAVSGNVISLDAPNMDMIDPLYATAELSKYTSARIEKCGIENMRISSVYASATDENHGWEAISFNNITNSWASNIEAYYFGYSAVHILDGAAWITVDNCKMLDAKSIITGSRRYSFNVDGQRNLIKNCSTREGRHDYVNGSRTCGPNVFYNCTATFQNNDVGPHHRWSTGILFDNIVGNGRMNVQNRSVSGSGHGWSGAQIMFWNCTAGSMVVQDPPGDHRNWAIGCICPNITNVGDWVTEPLGIVQSQGIKITAIPSLFIAQLNNRLTGILPVKMISFNASITGPQIVSLDWSTSFEANNAYFNIEHSNEGVNFSTIGKVTAKGNSTTKSDYRFEHKLPLSGTNYYRLKQIDVNGGYAYSDIKKVLFKKANLLLKNNVVANELEIIVSTPSTVNVFTAAGAKLLTINIKEQQTIKLNNYKTGIYFLKTEFGDTASFFKQ